MAWSNDVEASIDIAFGIIIAAINLFQAIYLSCYKKKRSNYECVLLSLSIADLLFGLSNFSIGISFFTSQLHEEVFEITVTTYFFFILTSILHLSWITIDRLWAVYAPIKHNYTVTKKRINILLAFTWLATTFVSLFLILHDELVVEKGKDLPPNGVSIENITVHVSRYQKTMETTLSSFIVGINVIFVVSYGLLIYVILEKSKRLNNNKNQQVSSSFNKETKVVITCLLISVSFLCFTLPFAITVFVDGKSSYVSGFFLQLNSAANSIVYFLRNKITTLCKAKKPDSNFALDTTPISTPKPLKHFDQQKSKGNLLTVNDNKSM